MTATRPIVATVISHLAVGGAENVAITLAEALHEQVDFRFFVVLRSREKTEVGREMSARLSALNIPVAFGTALPFKRGGAAQAAWNLRRRIAQIRPAAVHLHTEIPEFTLALATLFPGIGSSVAVIRTIHNTRLWPEWKTIGCFVERRLAHATVVGVSRAALEAHGQLSERCGAMPKRAAPHRHLIHNGVRQPPAAARNHGSAPQILFAGRFERQKGADLLPAILNRAARRSALHAEVTLAGTGTLENNLKTSVELSSLRWPVRIVRPIADLAGKLGRFDAILMPSRFEGLPLIAIEALLAGVPVVSAAAPGLVEVIPPEDPLSAPVDDVDGLAQHLATCLEDLPRFRAHVATRIPQLQAKFGIRQMAARYLELYGELASP